MPKFVIEREVPGAGNLTDEQLREISQKSVNVLRGLGPEIQWLHSYVTGDKVYCVYIAADEKIIREHARQVGLPANRVSAVRRLLDPSSAEEFLTQGVQNKLGRLGWRAGGRGERGKLKGGNRKMGRETKREGEAPPPQKEAPRAE